VSAGHAGPASGAWRAFRRAARRRSRPARVESRVANKAEGSGCWTYPNTGYHSGAWRAPIVPRTALREPVASALPASPMSLTGNAREGTPEDRISPSLTRFGAGPFAVRPGSGSPRSPPPRGAQPRARAPFKGKGPGLSPGSAGVAGRLRASFGESWVDKGRIPRSHHRHVNHKKMLISNL